MDWSPRINCLSVKAVLKLHLVQGGYSSCKHFTGIVKGKGKAIPLQTRTDPGGSRRVRLPDFKIIGT